MQASEQALRAGHLRPFFWLVTQFSKGIQRSKINMEWNEEVISCVANLSVRFRSPGTGFSVLAARKMNERKRPRSCSIFRPAKTEIPIPRWFFFVPKPQGNLLGRLKKPGPQACKQAPWGRAPKSSPESLLKGLFNRGIVVVSPGRKSIRPMTNKTIQHGLSEMFCN